MTLAMAALPSQPASGSGSRHTHCLPACQPCIWLQLRFRMALVLKALTLARLLQIRHQKPACGGWRQSCSPWQICQPGTPPSGRSCGPQPSKTSWPAWKLQVYALGACKAEKPRWGLGVYCPSLSVGVHQSAKICKTTSDLVAELTTGTRGLRWPQGSSAQPRDRRNRTFRRCEMAADQPLRTA